MSYMNIMQQHVRQNTILDILRGHRQPTTAAYLAQKMDVTVRTIYRDVATMIASNVPIHGEPGVGYSLEAGYDLPPLMFSAEELEALMLGAEMVKRRGDFALVQAAQRAMDKIAFILPPRRKGEIDNMALRVVPVPMLSPDTVDLAEIRAALRQERKLQIDYEDETGVATQRIIWPIVLGYFEQKRILVAYCEARKAFRHFRSDRIKWVTMLPDNMPESRKALEIRWRDETPSLRFEPKPETST
jgi:predicted DNA-binding transcriptional regulator YafY